MSSEKKRSAPAPQSMNINECGGIMTVMAEGTGNRFSVRPDGVYLEGDAKSKEKKLCDRVEIVAHTRTEDGRDWGMWLRFEDADGSSHELVISRKLLTQGRKVEELLASEGLRLYTLSGNSGKCLLAEFFNAVPMIGVPRALSVGGGGFASDAFNSFVFSNAVVALDGAEQVKLSDPRKAAELVESGTLEGWQDEVAAKALYSVRLMFGLCVGLSAPLLKIVDVPSTIYHLNGKKGKGKTSILRASISIWGGNRLLTWYSTGVGLEGLATQYNNQTLILDEIGQATPDAINAIYNLCNETAKVRMDRNSILKQINRWSINVLSAGEMTLTEAKHQMARNKQSATASGELVRFISIPAESDSGLGVLDKLPPVSVGEEEADTTARAAAFVKSFANGTQTGCAGRAYLMGLMDDVASNGREAFKERLKTIMGVIEDAIKEQMGRRLSDSELRVLERFAVVALAGELATGYGVMGKEWKSGDATRAVIVCFKAWADSGESPDEREVNVVEKILGLPVVERANFMVYSPSGNGYDFTDYPRQSAVGIVAKMIGDGGKLEHIATVYFSSQFKDMCDKHCEGLSRREVLDALIEKGLVYNKRKSESPQKDVKHKGQFQVQNMFGCARRTWIFALLPDSSDESREKIEKFFREARDV